MREGSLKTYPIHANGGGRAYAFEVENIYLSVATAARLLAEVEGVVDVKRRRALSRSSDVHMVFKYCGRPYMIWEPYGDSSRYWVGPQENAGGAGDIAALEAVFKRYRPPLHRALLGEVLSLRWIARFLRGALGRKM